MRVMTDPYGCSGSGREFENMYVGLNETLVVRGKVNPEAMACLYRKKGQGVNIHLVTRYPRNLVDYLNEFHIPTSIFTTMSQIFDYSSKSQYMVPNSVFIDDSPRERSMCWSDEKNIRCFDIDAFRFL